MAEPSLRQQAPLLSGCIRLGLPPRAPPQARACPTMGQRHGLGARQPSFLARHHHSPPWGSYTSYCTPSFISLSAKWVSLIPSSRDYCEDWTRYQVLGTYSIQRISNQRFILLSTTNRVRWDSNQASNFLIFSRWRNPAINIYAKSLLK